MKHLYFSIVALILFSCASVDRELYEFDPRKVRDKEVFLSDIAEDIKYIPLDDSIPIGRLTEISIGNDDIILDEATTGLLRYDLRGNLLNRIGSKGRGPNEYLYSMFFTRDNETGYIYNFSDRNNTVKVFSKEGNMIRDFRLDVGEAQIVRVVFFNSRLFIQTDMRYDVNDFEWIVCDTLGRVLKTQKRHLPKFSTNYSGTGLPNIFSDRITYYNDWTDTIYSVDKDFREKPVLVVAPGGHRYPRGYVPIDQILQNIFFGVTRFIETQRYFLFQYHYHGYKMTIVDKETWTESTFQYELDEYGMFNDLDCGLWSLPNFYYSENGDEYLIGIQYPYQIIARAASEEFRDSHPKIPEKKIEFEELAASLEETDNPVIVMVKLK